MLRIVVWGIPAVGFDGTAPGIGNALLDVNTALMEDISSVSAGLDGLSAGRSACGDLR